MDWPSKELVSGRLAVRWEAQNHSLMLVLGEFLDKQLA
jgi:hypothetical protein